MEGITKKIAAYVFTSSGPDDNYVMFRTDQYPPDTDYLRISEFVEVSLPKLASEAIAQVQIEAIDCEIEQIKATAMSKVSQLQQRKQELLALEHIEP